MAASDRLTGTNFVFEFLPTGGTPGVDERVVSADFTDFGFSRNLDLVDVTAGNETTEYSKGTIERMDFNGTIFYAKQTWVPDILPGAEGLLSCYPNGKTNGEPFFAFNCIFSMFEQSDPFDGAIEINFSGKRQGNMVNEIGSTYSA